MRRLASSLAESRRRFGRGAATHKLRLLDEARRLPLRAAGPLRAYHDHLLFLLAWPDDARVRAAAEAELHRVAEAAPRARRALDNSGIAGTDIVAGFTPDLVDWLVARHHAHVDVNWENDALAPAIEELLPLLVSPVEADGLLARHVDTREWLVIARAGKGTDLAWLLTRLRARTEDVALRERLLAALSLEIRWRLDRDSRTFTRFPARPVVYHRAPLARGVDLAALLETPLPSAARLDAPARAALVEIARAALAARARETDPVTWANAREVTLFRLEDGTDIALFGLLPGHRLSIESYFGFVAAKNRIPVAYGGGWVLGGRCEIGVNLFPEFRGGESAHLFGQVLRVYRQHYRVRQFLVDPYQFGRGNTEAIRSGAFWFYWRLGFRPTIARVHARAATEWDRLLATGGQRTGAALLRRFAVAPLYLGVPVGAPPPPGAWRAIAPDLAELGLAATRWLARDADGDRSRAEADALRVARRALHLSTLDGWSGHERDWLTRLAPLVAMHPDRERWSEAQRRLVTRAIRAKGGRRERDFVFALRRAPLLGDLG